MPEATVQVEHKAKGEFLTSQLTQLVRSRQERSAELYQPDHTRFRSYYDVYRGWYSRKYHPFRNNINIPITFSMVQSWVARISATLLGAKPWVTIVGGGPEDEAIAKKRETLLQVQLEDARTFEKAVDLFTSTAIYGTGIYRWWWEQRTGTTEIRVDMGPGEQLISAPTYQFNGPQWAPVDVLDFFPAPGFARIADAPWVVYRYWLDIEEVRARADAGFFDEKAVRELERSGGTPTPVVEQIHMRRIMGSGAPPVLQDHWAQPVEILEYWGKVPEKLGGGTSRVLACANRAHLVRDVDNPYPGREIPFDAFSPMPDPHYFYGPSIVEVNFKLQVASNRIANQKMDAIDLTIDPMYIYNKRSGFDPRQLRTRPLGAIGMDGPVDESMIRTLSPDLRGLMNSHVELEQQSRWMQQGAGITEDTVQGFSAGDRVTKAEFQGRQEAVSNRLLLGIRLAETRWLEALAQRFLTLDRKFLPLPQQLRMIGAAAVIDPVTLQPLEQEPLDIGVNDLIVDYDIRAIGATRQMSTAARQQNMLGLLQVVQTNPIAAAAINWIAFLRQLFYTFELPNPNQLLNTEGLMLQVLAQASAMGGGQQQGAGGEGPEGGGVLGIDPGVMSGLLGGGAMGAGAAGGGAPAGNGKRSVGVAAGKARK